MPPRFSSNIRCECTFKSVVKHWLPPHWLQLGMQGGVDFELSRVKLNFVISMWVVLLSWVYVHFRSFQNNEVQASLSTHPIQSCFLYNLQVHDHHQIFSLFFSWAVFTSFYLYPNFCCIVISSGCCWIILTWCLVPIWNFSVNVFKRTSCREVPHLLIKDGFILRCLVQ